MRRSYIKFHRRWWPGWERVEDDGCGVIENLARTLELSLELASKNGQEWAVMCQDDGKPVPGLVNYLSRILTTCPTDIAAFYSCRPVKDPRLLTEGVRWYVHPTLKEGPYIVMMAMRCDLVTAAVEGTRTVSDEPYADRCLQTWLKDRGIRSATHIPSLVQHFGRHSVRGNPWKVMGVPRISPTFPDGLVMREVLERYPYSKDPE
jgi:hypothetical protein